MFKLHRFYIIFFCFFLITNANSDDRKIVYLNLDLIVQNSVPGKFILEQLEIEKKSSSTLKEPQNVQKKGKEAKKTQIIINE